MSTIAFGQVVLDREIDVQTETSIVTEKASASAAMVAAQICQKGVSGQIESGGFSINNADGFCDLVRLSDVMLAAAEVHETLGNTAYADKYMKYHHQALEDANSLIVQTKYTTYLEKVFSSILIPLLMVIGLVLII